MPAEGSHGVCDACASALGDVQGLVTGGDPGARVRRPGSGVYRLPVPYTTAPRRGVSRGPRSAATRPSAERCVPTRTGRAGATKLT